MFELTPDRLDVILERARHARVLVVGDVMLDVYLRGDSSRVSTEAPVPIVRVSDERHSLGGAANVAANVAALGARCDVVGCVGRDWAGDTLRAEAERLGLGGSGLCVVDDRPTTVKTRLLVRHHQVARYDRELTALLDADQAAGLVAAIEELGAAADAIVLEDYDKGALVTEVIEAALDVGRRHGRPVVVDPKVRHYFEYGGATVFKSNIGELTYALQAPALVDDADWMERIRRRLDCSNLLVTLGERGVALATENGEFARLETRRREVYDVSGAGDTVTAALAVALAAGATPLEAAALANHAAGLEVDKAGVATVSPDELRTAIRRAAAPAAAGAADPDPVAL